MSFAREYGFVFRRGGKLAKWLKDNRLNLLGVGVRVKHKHKAVRVHMYDDVNVALIPKDAVAVAGYIGGRWPTFPKVVAGWPHAKHLSIAVSSIYDADCLDVEPGDAASTQAAAWIRKQHTRGKALPIAYTSISQAQHLVNLLDAGGLRYGVDYLLWTAHYDPSKGEHICSPKCGFGFLKTAHGTQFTDHADNTSLDESLVSPKFFS